MDVTRLFDVIWHELSTVFLTPGSTFSLNSLLCAFLVAALVLAFRRLRRGRPVRIRTLVRALLPKRFFNHASSFADYGLFLFNAFVIGSIFGWAMLSFGFVSHFLFDGLSWLWGPPAENVLPGFAARALITLTIFLAYELGYWLDHYLSHRIPFLWEFHKVHHTAEVLTPWTVWRVHPVDSIVFFNIVALTTAIANGFTSYFVGRDVPQYALSDTNILLVVFIHVYVHLQHTHLWIAFRGALGRVLLSPAHHQVHHSTNPVHFNKNMGSCLALWDWVFGTLHIPSREPEKLNFGVEDEHGHEHHHTVTGVLLTPFLLGWRHLLKGLRWLENAPAEPRAKDNNDLSFPTAEGGAGIQGSTQAALDSRSR